MKNEKGHVYVKSNCEIFETIHSGQLIYYQKKSCGTRTSTCDANAHNLRGCGVNDDLKKSQGTGNEKSCHKHQI